MDSSRLDRKLTVSGQISAAGAEKLAGYDVLIIGAGHRAELAGYAAGP